MAVKLVLFAASLVIANPAFVKTGGALDAYFLAFFSSSIFPELLTADCISKTIAWRFMEP